ncbi:MAG: histidinol-phosphate transaminase [Candidatus Bathyarchaeota archaeon]
MAGLKMSKKVDWLENRLQDAGKIQEYSSGEYTFSKKDENKTGKWIKLDANENLFLHKSQFTQLFREVTQTLNPRLYPQNEKINLINALSEYLELPSDCFTIGNGSDELIETTVKAFLRKSERVISITPTFAMYEVIVNAYNNVYDAVPLGPNFVLDVDALLSKIKPQTVLCILCSPNNPTGNQFKLGSVRKLLQEFKGVVLMDEAYAEFAPSSTKEQIKEFDNLIILRTFSKSFSLAGLRIGYSLACPQVTALIRRYQLPWNVNQFSMQMATKVLEKKEVFIDTINRIKNERTHLISELNKIPRVKAFHSDANFVLFRTEKDADEVFNELKKRRILIRNIGDIPGFSNCLRVTVGLPEMNNRFIKALDKICDE